MFKHPDEACVHRRVCGEHTAEVYLSRDMTHPDQLLVRVVLFDRNGKLVDETRFTHQRSKDLAFTWKRPGQADFVMPEPGNRAPPMRLAPSVVPARPSTPRKKRRAA